MMTNQKQFDRIVAALVLAPAVVVLAGCTSGQDSEPVGQETTLGVVSPVELFDAERLFVYGQPTISEFGTGSGTYNLPEPLTTGQTVMVSASCVGGENVSVETDEGLIGMRSGCSNPSGTSAEQTVESVVQDGAVTVDVGGDNAYWLNLFVVDPTEPALPEPVGPDETLLQEWSIEAVAPKAEEMYRWVDTSTGPTTEAIDITPGTYRWAASCRNGNEATFIVSIDDDTSPNTLSCEGAGAIEIHAVFTVEEPTVIEFTTDTVSGTDLTFALARQR